MNDNIMDGQELLRRINSIENPDGSHGIVTPEEEQDAEVRTKPSRRKPKAKTDGGGKTARTILLSDSCNRKLHLIYSASRYLGSDESNGDIIEEALDLLRKKRKADIEKYLSDISGF